MHRLSGFKESLHRQITAGTGGKRQQLIVLLFSLGCISTGMSVLNIFTHKTTLLLATALFAAFSFAAVAVAHIRRQDIKIPAAMFVAEIFALFTYFIVCGGTEGFSTIWLLLLPACGPFAFGKKTGTRLTGALFIELVFFFYTPWGRSLLVCTEYTQSFLMRFPVLYAAFWLIGYFLETVREYTYELLQKSQKEYQYLSVHDALTGVYNRSGFNSAMDEVLGGEKARQGVALLIMDIDHFKDVNDTYGHPVGDVVLRNVAACITGCLQGQAAAICRWGGEEFAVLLWGKSAQNAPLLAETLRAQIEAAVHEEQNAVRTTVSIGVAGAAPGSTVSAAALVGKADANLYWAKEHGRNRVHGTVEADA